MTQLEPNPASPKWKWLACLGLFAVAFLLNTLHNDFPVGYHFDEPKKVRFITAGDQDFHHPVLMLEAIRWPCWLLGLTEDASVARCGRTVIAIFGAGISVVVFLICCLQLPIRMAVLAGLATAVCPTVVVHSHYIKEDIPLVFFSLLALYTFARYLAEPGWGRAGIAGALFGCAIATHYKGILLLAPIGIYLVVFETKTLARHLAPAVIYMVSGAWCFLLVNNVILENPQIFLDGVQHESKHAIDGHFVPIRWYDYYLGYHLFYSVLPGMTSVAGGFCVLSFAWFTFKFLATTQLERLMILFGWISYLVPEISPLKPNPDECRYVLPLIPILIYFGVKLVNSLEQQIRCIRCWNAFGGHWIFAGAVVVTIVILPLVDSARLCWYMNEDTRETVRRLAEQSSWKLDYEPLAGTKINKPWGYQVVADRHKLEAGTTHFVCSSFAYSPYLLAEKLTNQPERVRRRRAQYKALFAAEVATIKPRYRSFAFSNPTLKVIRIDAIPHLSHDQETEAR